MTTAVVTITCPSCGGKVEGIQATNVDQKVKCSYCGTELHVPRVGEDPPPPAYEPPMVMASSFQQKSTGGGYIYLIGIAGLFALVTLPLVCAREDREKKAKQTLDQIDQDYKKRGAAHDKCLADCKAQCEHPVDQSMSADQLALLPPDQRAQLEELNRTVCGSSCRQKNDCYGMGDMLGVPR